MATVRQFTVATTLAPTDTFNVAHGLGATPVAALIVSMGYQSGTDGASSIADPAIGFALVTGTSSRRAVIFQSQAPSMVLRNDAVGGICYSDGNMYGRLDLSSWDATNATFVIDTESFFSQARYWVLFLGPDDCDEVALVDFTEPAATGTQDITGLSGGEADAAIFLGIDSTAALNTIVTTGFAQMFGVATRNGEAVWLGTTENGAGSTQRAYCRDGECIAMCNHTTQTFDARATLDSWITNGVRINWATRTTTGRRYVALLIRGNQFAVNGFTTSTSAGTNVTVSGLPGATRGGVVISAARAESAASTLSNDIEGCFGAFESTTTRVAQTYFDPNGAGDWNAALESDEVYVNINATPTVDGAADIDVIGATSIEFDQSDADTANNFAWVFTIHDAAAANTTANVNETVSITDSIVVGLTLPQAPAVEVISLSDSIIATVQQDATRATVDETISLADSIVVRVWVAQVVNESISIGAVEEVVLEISVNLTDETISLTDSIIATVQADNTRVNVDETISLSTVEVVGLTLSFEATGEVVSLTDSIVVNLIEGGLVEASVDETISLADNTRVGLAMWFGTPDEAISLTDSVAVVRYSFREDVPRETITITDSFTLGGDYSGGSGDSESFVWATDRWVHRVGSQAGWAGRY